VATNRETLLRVALVAEGLLDDFDTIILDTPPSLQALETLWAA
jgi:cellulose biosynthesis protein BcsQ